MFCIAPILTGSPVVMGILNLTPDSFYDGGRYAAVDIALRQTEKMLQEGAKIIDVGGMSSRPGSEIIATETEQKRVLPILRALVKAFPTAIFSIDTLHAATAIAAIEEGANMVNDISAGQYDAAMLSTVARASVPYVAMHMQGTPATMQQAPHYSDVVHEVYDFLARKIAACQKAGIKEVLVDPGFGFGKTQIHNFALLKNLAQFQQLGVPLLVGLSRKSMVTRTLGITAAQALNGTTVLHTIALLQGAKILRVHDVKEAVEVVKLVASIENVL